MLNATLMEVEEIYIIHVTGCAKKKELMPSMTERCSTKLRVSQKTPGQKVKATVKVEGQHHGPQASPYIHLEMLCRRIEGSGVEAVLLAKLNSPPE